MYICLCKYICTYVHMYAYLIYMRNMGGYLQRRRTFEIKNKKEGFQFTSSYNFLLINVPLCRCVYIIYMREERKINTRDGWIEGNIIFGQWSSTV